jgi:hypothetical protein
MDSSPTRILLIEAAAQMADYGIIDLPSQPCAASQSTIAVCNLTVPDVEREPGSMADFLASSDVRAQLGCQIAGAITPAAERCASS